MCIEIFSSILFYLKMLQKEMKYKSPDKYGRESDYVHLTFLIEILEEYIKNDSNFADKYYDHIIRG